MLSSNYFNRAINLLILNLFYALPLIRSIWDTLNVGVLHIQCRVILAHKLEQLKKLLPYSKCVNFNGTVV